MRPYHIEINWIDFNPTIEDDIYEVIVFDKEKKHILTSWKSSGVNVGMTISKYMLKNS